MIRLPFCSKLRWLRHAPDRLLHRRRRREARQRLRAVTSAADVLFICSGNICRSPYAEATFREASADMEACSAGLFGPGRPPPETALHVASRRGIDLSRHRSRLFEPDAVGPGTIVFVMDLGHLRAAKAALEPHNRHSTVILLGDLDPESITTRVILDPVDRSERFFEDVFDRLDRCVGEVVRTLAPIEPDSAAG